MLKDLKNQQRVTALISSHDLNHITDVCDRIILMEKGIIIQDLQKNENTLRQLQHYFSDEYQVSGAQ